MRRVTTCAPILAEGKYTTPWIENVPERYTGQANTSAKFYEFGAARKGNYCDATDPQNVTATVPTFCTTKYERENFRATYTVRSATAYHNNVNLSGFDPIPDFQVADSDVTLVSIFSQAEYNGNVTDPLFLATNVSTSSSELYTSTNDLNILGCTEQYQLCNLGNQHCTPLTGLYGIQQAMTQNDLSLSPRQLATSNIIWKAAWAMGLQWAVEVLGANVLLARDWVFTVDSVTSAPLPANQWHLEAQNLHNFSLAVFQRRIGEYAQPENFQIRPDTNSLDQIVPPTDADMRALCALQKVRSAAHSSVSVLGLCIILVVGALLVLLDWVFVQQMFWLASFSRGRHARKMDWTSSGALQLHRLALEARGVGPWDAAEFEFPTLREGRERKGAVYTTVPSLGEGDGKMGRGE
ncbi:hypothetical protein P153DRAFT_374159 [Dothidotthia symphoricarpi CBS 119687]|uniref:Uncharacterized protein n=1 Tax=Dothidotthia symphoricarpi CBS 119687 TaxID=1392245 RepID=A0A6A6AKE8_9PLEO|nr:uncharacterized protein P153DRAFT_374159 [Dothidotthia symphoricarpi CBS 119687]KAF2132432.1 hypothetical protein P153DRAFT_374159 [Dothidotthia symphoricarpi CBS 119687]